MNKHKVLIPTIALQLFSFPITAFLLAVLIVMVRDTTTSHGEAAYETLFCAIVLMPIGVITSTVVSIRTYSNAVFQAWIVKKFIKYWVVLLLPILGLLTGFIINS
tara:strand:+ start:369 stop:683 length:315 start_codon:yes stop_codon:yes gene_type:complete